MAIATRPERSRLPYPPPWQDLRTLALHLCAGESTIEKWVKEGRLPPAKLIGGKRMWKWAQVERWLDDGGENMSRLPDAEAIRNATRRAAQGQ